MIFNNLKIPVWISNFYLIACAVFMAPNAFAAEIKFFSAHMLHISGEIIDGDYKKLIHKIAENENSGKGFLTRPHIIINSSGGLLSEAQKIGSLISDIHATVTVSRKCFSACFWMVAASNKRNITKLPGGSRPEIGLHNVYLDGVTSSSMTASQLALAVKRANEVARLSLVKLEVPSYLIDKMISKTSAELYYLTDEDILNLGDYPPSVNQVRVSKCNADPILERQFSELLMGLRSRFPYDIEYSEKYFERVNSCWGRLWKGSSEDNFNKHLSMIN
jgi:hypothetical protein